jgi:hypothetical protein
VNQPAGEFRLTDAAGKFERLQAALIIAASVVRSDCDGIGQVVGQKKRTHKVIEPN